ncbi:Hypothetical predicted protein, partial [Paramuricea clavata]
FQITTLLWESQQNNRLHMPIYMDHSGPVWLSMEIQVTFIYPLQVNLSVA